jgi:hypothetical protein
MDNINLIILLFIFFYLIFNYIKLLNKKKPNNIKKETDIIEKETDIIEKKTNIIKKKTNILNKKNLLLYPINTSLINVSEFGGSKPYNNININNNNLNVNIVDTIYNKKYNSYRKYKLNK